MSEKIPVKVQLKDEKRVIRLEYDTGLPFFASLSEKLTEEGVAFSLCGGKGICGKCRIRFLQNAPMPGLVERKFLKPEELRRGIRLACMTKPVKACDIEVLFAQNTHVITAFNQKKDTDRPDRARESTGDAMLSWQKMQGEDCDREKKIFTADVGTTTIAMARVDSVSGEVEETFSCMNPQSVYGSDVIARITAAGEIGGMKLQEAVLGALQKGLTTLYAPARELSEKDLQSGESLKHETVYVAANTVMNHFLTGSDAAGLGSEPFRAEFLSEKMVCTDRADYILLPGISAFVGGDITAGLLSCGMLPITEESRGELFLDLGTNGEMALSNGHMLYCSAAAAGPAFEGKNSANRGSHMVHFLAELLKSGQMDETGLLHIPEDESAVTQKEIRDLQMAKAAVRTGIEVLLQKTGMKYGDLQRVWLAGGFGYYIQVEDAVAIGLLPREFEKITVPVGNAALRGAAVYAGLTQEEKELLENSLRKDCVAVNLAQEEYFREHYVDAMNFQKMVSP